MVLQDLCPALVGSDAHLASRRDNMQQRVHTDKDLFRIIRHWMCSLPVSVMGLRIKICIEVENARATSDRQPFALTFRQILRVDFPRKSTSLGASLRTKYVLRRGGLLPSQPPYLCIRSSTSLVVSILLLHVRSSLDIILSTTYALLDPLYFHRSITTCAFSRLIPNTNQSST